MEITRAQNYTRENHIVIMFSRDIQGEVDEQDKTIEIVSSHAVSTDYCNIMRDFFIINKCCKNS